jgi:hypothetical protein
MWRPARCSCCRQVAATLLQSTELDGFRGTGEGSTISGNYKAMRAKIASRLGFTLHRLIEFESLRRNP